VLINVLKMKWLLGIMTAIFFISVCCHCKRGNFNEKNTGKLVLASDSSMSILSDFVEEESFLWDLEVLSKVPKVDWIKKDKICSFLYQSADYNGKPTKIFAYYSNPGLLAGEVSGNKKYPGVILVHGGKGKAFKEWVEKWALDGYAAIAMDLSGNGENGEELEEGGPSLSEDNIFKKIEKGELKNVWTYQAVSSVILAHSLLLSFPEVDIEKTCITGISYGGYITCIAASLDNRFKAAAPVYGCAYFEESDYLKNPLNQLSSDNKTKWMTFFDPSLYLPFAKPQFLFINGNKDLYFNVVPYQKTIRLLPQEQRTICIKPDMEHNYQEGWAPVEIKFFFESVINQSNPLLKVYQPSASESIAQVKCNSPMLIKSAVFYYSNDSLSSNLERVWSIKETQIDFTKNMITCEIAKRNYKYGFFYLHEKRDMAVSSEFIIN
jgi:dienelactone hydrolase